MNYYYPQNLNSQSKSIWVLDALSTTDSTKTVIRDSVFHPGTNVFWGLGHNNHEIIKMSSSYIFTDMPYWKRWNGDNRLTCHWRVIPGALHCNWVKNFPNDRFQKLGITLRDQRQSGSHILVCPSSIGLENFYNKNGWTNRVINELKKHTDRPIRIRQKPRANGTSGPMVATVPLDDDFKDAWAVVTLASIVGVEAICAGIPVFCDPASPCAPVGNLDLKDIESPRFELNQLWLNTLAYYQYTEDELKKGLANVFILSKQ